jgi:very-short-patch-repair endonuclease
MTYTCANCGKQFEDKPSQKRTYCSRACFHVGSKGRPRAPREEAVLVECDSCGDDFEVSASKFRSRESGRFFCSTECRDQGASTKVPRKCETCKKVSRIKPSELVRIPGRGRYCSVPCKAVGQTQAVHCKCLYCQTPFTVTPFLKERGVGVYCSVACRAAAKSEAGTAPVECLQCGTAFRAYLSALQSGWGKYCSKECQHSARRTSVEIACQICGDEFLAQPSQIANGTRFCSRDCVDKWQRESPEARKFQLANLRKQLKRKKPTRCERVLYQLMEVVFGEGGFEREHPVGFWTVDTAVPDFLLVVQADGDFWHGKIKPKKGYPKYVKETMKRDKAADSYMRNHGWTVLRFWECELMDDPESCLARIQEVAGSLTAETPEFQGVV